MLVGNLDCILRQRSYGPSAGNASGRTIDE